ncbi:MAG TPA: tRNA (N6-isopentenyl adenosine(37)-C2)-methylthiotransferase MiaB [Pyrinomonadaceae bacterium]|jgi:tRNA-2-methylthio-N6-dimethylallyladenosine synthase
MKTSVYIETHGCQMNVADTERAADRLRASGYELTETAEGADVVLFNTCSVRERAAQKVFNRIGEVRGRAAKNSPLIGVMGCVAQLEGAAIFEQSAAVDLVAGTRATDRLPQLIERARSAEKVLDLGERGESDTWTINHAARHSKHVAFVPIIEGCNKFCSYCIVPYSRGRERSRAAGEILEDVWRLREEGFREVHLIGQNVNSYRPRSADGLEAFAGATPFTRLLRAVAATGIERVKFTTSFPRDFHEDIVKALDEHENLCDWVHLPVQSGSDRILRSMRRGHTAENYLRRIEKIKGARRRLSVTSDVIVGFPGETDADFEATMRLVEHCQYDGLYIFKYSERSGTPSATLSDDVSKELKTERFLALERLQRSVQSRLYARYVGSEVCVLVEGTSARSEADLTGHSSCHKVVNFQGEKHLIGDTVKVRITEAKTNSLYGELVTRVR